MPDPGVAFKRVFPLLPAVAAFLLAAWPHGAPAGEETAADRPRPETGMFADVRVGDWVLYRTPIGDTTRREEVVGLERLDDDVLIRIHYRYDSGGHVTETERTLKASEIAASLMRDGEPGLTASRGTVDFRGEALEVEILVLDQGESTLTMYYSDAVPLWGLVRAESSMIPMPAMQLLDFGRGKEQ